MLCKSAGEVQSARSWAASVVNKSRQELHLDTPASWNTPVKVGRDNLDANHATEVHLFGHSIMTAPGREDEVLFAPGKAALWTSGVVEPPLGEWQAVQGCLQGYDAGMRCDLEPPPVGLEASTSHHSCGCCAHATEAACPCRFIACCPFVLSKSGVRLSQGDTHGMPEQKLQGMQHATKSPGSGAAATALHVTVPK